MSIVRQLALALAAILIAGCGGGSPEPEVFSAQAMRAAQPAVAATSVTSAQAAELLMNMAESTYSFLFPGHKTTLTAGPFAYRYYPETGMYLGLWGSNVDFPVTPGEANAKTEIDVYAGYAGGDAKEGWGYDVGAIYYS